MPIEFQPEQIIEYQKIALSILIVLILGLVTYVILRRSLKSLYQKEYISQSAQSTLQIILRWIIIILVILLSLQQVGVQLTSVWATLSAVVVFAGVGLVAVWSVLSNALCSFLLLIFKPFSIGDQIEIITATGGEGLRGKVVNLNLLYTFILEEGDDDTGDTIAQVPNNTFFQYTIRRQPGSNPTRLEEVLFMDDMQSIKKYLSL